MALARELLLFAQEHFVAEEKYMQEIGYPKFKEHKEEHAKITIAVETLIVKLYTEGPIDAGVFERFADSWIMEHVMKKDSQIKEFTV